MAGPVAAREESQPLGPAGRPDERRPARAHPAPLRQAGRGGLSAERGGLPLRQPDCRMHGRGSLAAVPGAGPGPAPRGKPPAARPPGAAQRAPGHRRLLPRRLCHSAARRQQLHRGRRPERGPQRRPAARAVEPAPRPHAGHQGRRRAAGRLPVPGRRADGRLAVRAGDRPLRHLAFEDFPWVTPPRSRGSSIGVCPGRFPPRAISMVWPRTGRLTTTPPRAAERSSIS